MKTTKIDKKKLNALKLIVFLPISIMVLSLSSCIVDDVIEPIETVVEVENKVAPNEVFTLDNLEGNWIRIASNNPGADGIVIEMKDTSGRLLDKGGSNFNVNDIKWQNIKAVAEEF